VRTAGLPPAVHGRQRAQRLGVEYRRRRIRLARCGEQEPDQLGRGEPRAQPRADDDGVVLVVEDPGESGFGIDLLDAVLGQPHGGRLDDLGREQRLQRLGHG
jgi:hypothetical protein